MLMIFKSDVMHLLWQFIRMFWSMILNQASSLQLLNHSTATRIFNAQVVVFVSYLCPC